ncbi:SRPBCC family protein [Herbidospora yilanensis]|uniref:SRPBCC family protein n=1 Tax=Herbidospora yilanensis TaxID=354426 RepID=UPI0007834F8D|nr:SRPBCC family protein [Herbidospora yilanensis]
MRYESTVVIDAPPSRVWEVFSDVARWPEWTPTVDTLDLLDPGPLRVGSRARLRQPRLPVAVWRVTDFADGRGFTWVSGGSGLRTAGIHEVEAVPGGTRALLVIEQTGPLAPLVHLLAGRLTRRYLELEGQGLKARSERP